MGGGEIIYLSLHCHYQNDHGEPRTATWTFTQLLIQRENRPDMTALLTGCTKSSYILSERDGEMRCYCVLIIRFATTCIAAATSDGGRGVEKRTRLFFVVVVWLFFKYAAYTYVLA